VSSATEGSWPSHQSWNAQPAAAVAVSVAIWIAQPVWQNVSESNVQSQYFSEPAHRLPQSRFWPSGWSAVPVTVPDAAAGRWSR
jgi:hypothetical protein